MERKKKRLLKLPSSLSMPKAGERCSVCNAEIKGAYGYYVYYNDEGLNWWHPLCQTCCFKSNKILQTRRRIEDEHIYTNSDRDD